MSTRILDSGAKIAEDMMAKIMNASMGKCVHMAVAHGIA